MSADALRPIHALGFAPAQRPSHRVLRAFTSEGYAIDVRLEPDPSPRGARIAGQVLDVSGSPTPVSAIPILLVSGGKIVSRTMTCRLGKFRAKDLPWDSLELYVMVDPANCIKLPLRVEQPLHAEQPLHVAPPQGLRLDAAAAPLVN